MTRQWVVLGMCWVLSAASAGGCGDDNDRAGDGRDGGFSDPDGGGALLDARVSPGLGDGRVPSQPSDSGGGLSMDGTTGAGCTVPPETILAISGAAHVNGPIDYPDEPPAGGPHNGCWARWTVYDEELADERWVHNLEHGGVVFLHHCPDGCADEVQQMTSFVTGRQQALLSPYAALPTRFALVAWGVKLTSDCFDMARFEQFYHAHVGMGLEQISSDPPASCL